MMTEAKIRHIVDVLRKHQWAEYVLKHDAIELCLVYRAITDVELSLETAHAAFQLLAED